MMKLVVLGIAVVIGLLAFVMLRARRFRQMLRRSRHGSRRPEIIPVQAGQTLAETGELRDRR